MNLKEHINATWPELLAGVSEEIPLLTEFNIENLRKLIDALKAVRVEDFCMGYYMCGSSGCVLGHAALSSSFHEHFSGDYYSFGRDVFCDVNCEPALWDYLFSPSWAYESLRNEPTIEQAIQRIERVIHEFERTC